MNPIIVPQFAARKALVVMSKQIIAGLVAASGIEATIRSSQAHLHGCGVKTEDTFTSRIGFLLLFREPDESWLAAILLPTDDTALGI